MDDIQSKVLETTRLTDLAHKYHTYCYYFNHRFSICMVVIFTSHESQPSWQYIVGFSHDHDLPAV